MIATCEAIECEVFVCGEAARYSTKRDGQPTALCRNHAALAVQSDELVVSPAGYPLAYHHIDGDLYEVRQ